MSAAAQQATKAFEIIENYFGTTPKVVGASFLHTTATMRYGRHYAALDPSGPDVGKLITSRHGSVVIVRGDGAVRSDDKRWEEFWRHLRPLCRDGHIHPDTIPPQWWSVAALANHVQLPPTPTVEMTSDVLDKATTNQDWPTVCRLLCQWSTILNVTGHVWGEACFTLLDETLRMWLGRHLLRHRIPPWSVFWSYAQGVDYALDTVFEDVIQQATATSLYVFDNVDIDVDAGLAGALQRTAAHILAMFPSLRYLYWSTPQQNIMAVCQPRANVDDALLRSWEDKYTRWLHDVQRFESSMLHYPLQSARSEKQTVDDTFEVLKPSPFALIHPRWSVFVGSDAAVMLSGTPDTDMVFSPSLLTL